MDLSKSENRPDNTGLDEHGYPVAYLGEADYNNDEPDIYTTPNSPDTFWINRFGEPEVVEPPFELVAHLMDFGEDDALATAERMLTATEGED